MSRAHVVLVPGFFGFANLGDLAYFGHVHRYLQDAYAARGLEPILHVVRPQPTASLPRRAARLLETLRIEVADDAPIHLVGHSTGGLDCRLLLSPGVTLPSEEPVEAAVHGVTAVVSVCTPHHGTPLASFFGTRLGGRLLELLSVGTMTALRFGHLPLSVLFGVGTAYARLDDLGANSRLLDHLFTDLLAQFTPDRRDAVTRFLSDVRSDQSLITQLTPDAMEPFAATTRDRAEVRYGSVVARAIPPSLGSWLASGLDPTAHLSHLVYRALRAAGTDPRARLPALDAATVATLRTAYDGLPDPRDSDGIVPTLSQVHGRVLHAARGDHLDVIGHYGDATPTPPHFDWLVTGSGFDQACFAALWDAVADFLTGVRPVFEAESAESSP
jgi:triacylglycerol lipase